MEPSTWREKLRGKRAQISNGDLLIAFFILFLALALVFSLWSTTTEKINDSELFYDLENTAVATAEKLVKTGGVPQGWGRENVTVIGLAGEPRILNPKKVLEFVDMMNDSAVGNPPCNDFTVSNYECSKHLLGIGKYNVYFTLTDINGTIIEIENISCVTGKGIGNETDKLTVTRTAILENEIVRAVLTLWYDE
jgi:hypothetical protein